uniref:Uncharacterized protein n=1 Tax=Cajanus cajan TaxID=3821 RepID=A0A151RUH3_CAJCA|nr:hypothetical protein KK1_032237 [Cajanus cajan]
MNTLQRSSFSFRRQGSSGRIWQDHMQFVDSKGNATTSASGKNKKYKEENNVSQMEENIMERRLHGSQGSKRSHSSSKSRQNKVHRGFFFSIFGRCMSSPTSRD